MKRLNLKPGRHLPLVSLNLAWTQTIIAPISFYAIISTHWSIGGLRMFSPFQISRSKFRCPKFHCKI